jgi:AraC family transcriptional regulator, positive regulator of tynA and feaB
MLLDTESFSPGLRFTEWRRRIEEIAGMDAEVVAPGESSFRSSVRHRNLGPLTILEFDVEPYQVRLAQKLGSAPRDRLVLWVSIDGAGWVEQGGVTAKLDPTILCLYGANRPRTFAFTTPSRGIALLLPFDAVRQALQGWELALPLNIDCTRGTGAVLAGVVRSVARHADELGEDTGSGLSNVLVGLLASVVSALPDSLRTMPSRLEVFHKARIKRFVREHLRDPGLDVDMVSRAVGLSTRYIHKLFSSEPEPLMKWAWAERIEGACKEIETTASRRKAISQIGFSWGFSGPAHFSRSFRNRYGVSPVEYRSRAEIRSKVSSAVE